MVIYQDAHRYCLQSFMSKRLMTERNAREVFAYACKNYNVELRQDDFVAFIAEINKKLKPLSMEIRHGKSEDDGMSYFSLVNCHEDEHSKVATDLSANEIAFFKKVLDLIVTSDDGYATSMTLVNVGMELDPKITASSSEALLTKLVEEQWLTEINGDLSLGPRSIIELSMYLKNIYQEEILDCKMCMHIVIKGQTCENCGTRIHLYCANKLFKGRPNEQRKCPGCKVQWLHEIPNINAVVEIEDEGMEVDVLTGPSQSRTSGESSRRRRSRAPRR
eukprot:gene4662-5271_t